MSNAEAVRQKVSRLLIPPFNDLDSLQSACKSRKTLLADKTLRMSLGINATALYKGHMINGQFGIKKFDHHPGEEVALCGFDIEKNEMVIRHTPQGKRPGEFSTREVRNRFGRSDFRIEMMQAMIDIAKKLGLKGIVGFPVRPYMLGSEETYLRKVKGRNTLFELFNFELKNKDQPNDAYYYLTLNSSG